ncbi:MAG: hypothetical protein QXX95_06925 [Nitrososphaerales archaeon]
MSLERLRQRLLFNNLLDTWISLCEEKGWNWFDIEAYSNFLNYLKSKNIKLNKLAVCVEEKGEKALFVKTFSKEKKTNFDVYALKLDNKALEVIRNFQKGESMKTHRLEERLKS